MGAAAEKGGVATGKIVRVQYVCTLLLGLSIVVYCCFAAFSIGVLDVNNVNNQELQKQRPPWPTLQSPLSARRWRALQSSGSSSSVLVNHPVKFVVPAEKALQGMGTLFRKGTRRMRELIVAHLSEETSLTSLRLFLRTLHRSGATARADVVFLFPGASISQAVSSVFQEEEASFQRMLALADPNVASKQNASDISNSTLSPFNSMVFKRAEEEQHVRGDVIWGNRSSNSSQVVSDVKPVWSGFGSVVGFEMQDLDPHNALSGFLDDPPAQIRRWVCYEMLLGMVRTKYRNVLLTQVKGVLFVGDALAPIRRRQYLYLSAEDRSWLDLDAEEFLEVNSTGTEAVHRRELLSEVEGDEDKDIEEEINPVPPPKSKSRKRNVIADEQQGKGLIPSVYGNDLWRSLDKVHRDKVVVSSSFAMGRIEYVHKLANKMATEIVRIALEKKNRRCFHDKAVLNYLVHQSTVLGKRVLDHMKIVPNKDSVIHSLVGSKQPHAFWKRRGKGSTEYAIIQGLNNTRSVESDLERGRKLVASLHNDICQSPAESQVYQDCLLGRRAPNLYR